MRLCTYYFALMLALSGSAPAQDIPKVDTRKSIQTTHKLAACVVRSRFVQWSELLALVPGSEEERARLRVLTKKAGDCLSHIEGAGLNRPGDFVALSFQPSVIRGPVAEALMKRFVSMPVAKRQSLARPFDMARAVAAPEMQSKTRTALVVLDFADCVYRSGPAEAAALFATEPASEEEGRAIKRLSSRLGPCLSAGMSFKINHLLLRGALTEAAYRYTVSATLSFKSVGKTDA